MIDGVDPRARPEANLDSRPRSPLAAALRLRALVLARRHANGLDAALLAGTVALGFLAGRMIGRDVPWTATAEAGEVALAALVAVALGGAAAAKRLLYRARELTILLPQPLGVRDLVALRLVELDAAAVLAGAILAALVAGASSTWSPGGAAAAALTAAPLLAGLQLVLAWVAREGGSAGKVKGILLPLLAVAVLVVLFLPQVRSVPALSSRVLPGGAFVALVRGDPWGGVVLLLTGVPACALALVLAPVGHAEALDASSSRPTRPPLVHLGFLGLLPLPRPSVALVRRDLLLLIRGAFPRGVVILALLPAGLLIFNEAARDRSLEAWEGELAALMTAGSLATIAAYVFAVDFPRARVPKLVLERAQPLHGSHVLLARTVEAAIPAVALAVAIGFIALRGVPRIADRSLEIGVSAALLGLACAHHGAAFGMQGEGAADEAALAAAYPLVAGMLVVMGAVALTISPFAAIAYPFVYGKTAARAALVWEFREVARTSAGA